MIIGMETLLALRKYDPMAERAYRSWLALADYQDEYVRVEAWFNPKTNKIFSALVGTKNYERIR